MKHFIFLSLFFFTFFLEAQTIEDDFEGNGTISTWYGSNCGLDKPFTNPYKTGINTSENVLKYTDNGGQYANIRFDTSTNFDLSNHDTFILKIYVPSSSITGNEDNKISLKLQDGSIESPWVTQTEIRKPFVFDQWQIISFDFEDDAYINSNGSSPSPILRKDLNRVVLQINGENNNSHITAYIDDFLYDETDTSTGPVFDNLVWSDEFDGNGAIDTSKWFHQTQLPSGGSWYNNEVQHYTNRTDNSNLQNGYLNITAKKETYTDQGYTKEYTSARLNSKFAFTYGKVEVRAKLPTGHGTWPAIWMLGKNIIESGSYWTSTHGTTSWPACGEIDIMEHWGKNQNKIQSAKHAPSNYGPNVKHGTQTIPTASTDFHIYSLEWSSEKMIFKVDGVKHYSYNPAIKDADTWPYDADQYLLLNIAIESDIVSSFTESSMLIDYVRVYQESTTSVKDIDHLKKIKLYPNPLKDKMTIQIPTNLFEVKGTLYSLLGKKINSFTQNSSKKEYDFSQLKKGVYLLKFETKTAASTYKIIKI